MTTLLSICLALMISSLLTGVIALALPITTLWLLAPFHWDRHTVLGVIGNVVILSMACYVLAVLCILWRVRRIDEAPIYGLLAVPFLNIWVWRRIRQRRRAAMVRKIGPWPTPSEPDL